METDMDRKLAQWVGISIISDVIDAKTLRNQFYIREAFETSKGIHPDLRRICSDMDKYFRGVYRSYVTYKLAPRINAISRAGFSASLAYVISDGEPPRIPAWALAKRDEVCNEALARAKRIGGAAFSNLSGIDDAWRYTGVAAAKLAAETGCVSVVFIVDSSEGAATPVRGSFRRSFSDADFLSVAKRYVNAAGHPSAFGFRGEASAFKELVKALSENASVGAPVQLVSESVKKSDIETIATWNGRVGSDDELYISTAPSELSFIRSQGKVSLYRWRGLEARLLSQEFPRSPRIYAEMQRGLALFVK
jgi:single-stranded DNA-specific DHH superfamily exonuclease